MIDCYKRKRKRKKCNRHLIRFCDAMTPNANLNNLNLCISYQPNNLVSNPNVQQL